MNEPVSIRRSLVVAVAAALPLAFPAAADAQDWLARVRAVGIYPNVSSSVPGLDVSNQWIPEVDFSYFFTKNIAAELVLGTARHEVTLNGTSLGKLSHLPPTLTVQYHFTDLGAWKPYVGAGLNVTWFYNVGLQLPNGTPLTVDNNSVGGAVQAGLDYELQKNWYLNFDVKYLWISTDVKALGTTVTNLKIDPLLYGIGVGYRF